MAQSAIRLKLLHVIANGIFVVVNGRFSHSLIVHTDEMVWILVLISVPLTIISLAVEDVKETLQLGPVLQGETETVTVVRTHKVVESLELLERAVGDDDVYGPEDKQRKVVAVQDALDEGADGGQFQEVEFDLEVVLSSDVT